MLTVLLRLPNPFSIPHARPGESIGGNRPDIEKFAYSIDRFVRSLAFYVKSNKPKLKSTKKTNKKKRKEEEKEKR